MRSVRPTAPAARPRPGAAGVVRRAAALAAGGLLALASLAATGCTAGPAGTDTRAWVPPRGGLVTHGLSADAEAFAGRGDADLGHPPEVRPSFAVATLEQRSRLSTERSGRIADHVVRRIRIREVRPR